MIFKQETIKSWFSGVGTSINNGVVQPFQNAGKVIDKYNLAIQHNSLTQKGWERLLAQSDDSLKAYLTSIKGTTASMTGYNVSLQGNITGFKKVSSAITQYNALSASGTVEQNTFANAVSATNSRLGTYLTGLNGANASLSGYIISLVGATIKTVALKVATIALNSAITMGASLIISGIVSAISAWINKTENMIEASEDAVEKIKSINDELKNNQKTISDTAKRYAELAQGVDQLTGKNISLSSEDYEEFLSLSNQLAEMFPTLTRNYNDNGDAIVQLSGDVDTIVGSLQNLIAAQRDLANRQIVDELPTIFDGVAEKSNAYEQKLSVLESKRDALVKSLGDVQSEEFSTNFMDGFANKWIEISGDNLEVISQMRDDYIKILEDANINYEELTPTYEIKDGVEVPVGFTIKINSSDEEIEKVKNTIDGEIEDLAKSYAKNIETLNEEINIENEKNKKNWASLNNSIYAWLSTDDSFKVMDDTMQATVQNIINSLDWGSLNFSSWEAAKQYIQDNILSLFNTTDGKEVFADIQVMFGIQTQFNNSDITVEQYQVKLQEFLASIESLPPESKKSIMLLFGIETNEDGTTTSSVDTMIANVEEKFEGADVNKLTLKDLEIAYSISSEEADKAIAEEKSKIKSELESLSKEGNVDLTIRPVIDSSAMQAAGWDVEDGSIATTFTQGEFIWQGDEENGQYVYVHYTPILPDGTVLTPDEMTDYLYGTLEGSQNVLDADDKGLVLKVDTDLNIPEEDIMKFQNGEGSTDAIDGLIQKTGEWDDKVHGVQEQYYDTGEGIGYASNALDGLIEKHKQLENPDEITVSFSEVFNSSDFSEQKEELLELAKAGELTSETLSSTEEYVTLLKQTGLSAESAKDKIYNLLSAQERLAGAHNGLDDLSNSYEEFKELNFVTAHTLEELPDVFKSLEGYDLFAKIVGNPESGVKAIQNAFNDIVKEYLIFTQTLNVNDLISDDFETQQRAINTYIANLKQMGVTNAEEVVNQTVESLEQQQTLLDNAATEYVNYLRGKGDVDLQYIESTASYNSQFINSLGEGYKTDYDNWLNLLKDKELAYQRFTKSLDGDGDGEFIYDPNKNIIDNLIANGKGTSFYEIIEAETAKAEYDRITKKYEDLRNSLTFNPSFSSDYSIDWDGLELGSGSSSNSDSDTYFDWIETKLDKLNDQLDKTKEKAEDSLNGWKIRADAFTKAENQINDLIATQEEAKARYLEEANKSGLSQPYIDLVQDGAIDIDKLSNDNPLKEQIESYKEWYDKVKECDEAIAELEVDLKQLYSDKREFRWEVFDYLEDSISRITDEADYLIELLSNENLFNDKGHLTKYADATLGLHFSSYDAYIQKAKDYEEEIKDLEGQLATGGQEVLDKYNERVDAHQEAINAAQQEKQAILDLINDGYQKQLDYLNETIEKRKELWATEKGLYDYQKSIAEKTQNIANLEKRKLALTNDNSEEARAQLQQIEVELQEAKQDLQETEMDKNIEEREKLLDTLSSEYEQWINEKLENSDELLTSIRDSLAPDGEIVNTLKEIASKNNTFVSDELTSSISDGANSSINSYLGKIIELLGGDDSFFGNAGSKIKGYASGIKRSGKELAWLNENGAEIIRTKDGALLKPLDNSMVFNNESSKRLWEFSQNPSAFLEKMGMNNIIQPIFNVPKLPNIERVSNQTPINNITHMEVVLPNVTNYDDFMNRMQNDKRFDNIVTASMNSKMTGGNSLSKFRF